MNVIGIKKCNKCGKKEVYGCNNYYTVGQPFFCCHKMMDNAPYLCSFTHMSKKKFDKIWNYFEKNIDNIDYKIIPDEKHEGVISIKWVGVDGCI